MPKELTHWILAEAARTGLGKDGAVGETLRDHRELYLAGAVLPDTLLHLFYGSGASQALGLARAFHDPEDNSYAPLIRAEAQSAGRLPPELLACLLGVLSHMQADIVFHPFVYAQAGSADTGAHYRLETAIDVHFLRRGLTPPVRRLDALVTLRTRHHLLAAFALLFDPENTLPPEALARALDLHCRFQGLYAQTFWKLLAGLLGRLPVTLLRQQRHLFYPLRAQSAAEGGWTARPWRHPITGAVQEHSVDDLAEESVRRTMTLLARIEANGSLRGALLDPPGENLLTGCCGVRRDALLGGGRSLST